MTASSVQKNKISEEKAEGSGTSTTKDKGETKGKVDKEGFHEVPHQTIILLMFIYLCFIWFWKVHDLLLMHKFCRLAIPHALTYS
jgi:hypothetical protein